MTTTIVAGDQYQLYLDASSNPVNFGDVLHLLSNGNARRADNGVVQPAVLDTTNLTSTVANVALLTAGTYVAVYADGLTPSGIWAVVFTTNAGIITPGLPVRVAAATLGASVAALSATSFVVGYQDGTTSYPSAVVCSVSGTTITAGTAVAINAVATTFACSVAALSASTFVATYGSTTSFLHGMVCSVSGTTVTTNTDTVLVSVALTTNPSVAPLSVSLFAVSYGGASTFPRVIACSISGTTITPGTAVQIVAAASTVTCITALDATHFVVGYVDGPSTWGVWCNVCSVSGTTISKGTSVKVTTGGNSTWINIASVSASTFVVTYATATMNNAIANNPSAVICTQAAGVITAGSEGLIISQNGNVSAVAPLDTANFVAVCSLFPSDQIYGVVEPFTGKTLTAPGYVVSNTIGPSIRGATAGDVVFVGASGALVDIRGVNYTTGSVYYWDRVIGQVSAAPANDLYGLALAYNAILLGAAKVGVSDQFFG